MGKISYKILIVYDKLLVFSTDVKRIRIKHRNNVKKITIKGVTNMNQLIQSLVERSRKAQQVLCTYDQEKTDAIVRMFAKVIFDNAEPLAKLAVEESRMGVYEDKVTKNKGKSRIIWNALKAKSP